MCALRLSVEYICICMDCSHFLIYYVLALYASRYHSYMIANFEIREVLKGLKRKKLKFGGNWGDFRQFYWILEKTPKIRSPGKPLLTTSSLGRGRFGWADCVSHRVPKRLRISEPISEPFGQWLRIRSPAPKFGAQWGPCSYGTFSHPFHLVMVSPVPFVSSSFAVVQ